MAEFVWVIKGVLRHFEGTTRASIVGVRKTEPDAKLRGWEWMRSENERLHNEGKKVSASYEVYRFPLL